MFAKGARRRVPVILLLVAAFGPDIVEMAFDLFHRQDRVLSHSLVSVAICATALALGYMLIARARGADALAVWFTYVMHWPADYLTGIKPTWPGGPMFGRVMYANPLHDAFIEVDLILLCWVFYWFSLPLNQRVRRSTLMIPWVLIGIQFLFDYGLTKGFPGT